MEKVLAVGTATVRLSALKTGPEEAEAPSASPAPATGNAMCPVLFLEMVDFSRKPVADQLVLRERFNGRVARALEQVPLLDRMVLETTDGVAITFLGGPEAALHVALRFAHTLQPASGTADPLQVRGGMNLGPVRLTSDAAGHTLVLGDGINVAQRLLGFAAAGQFLVSRAYHETLCQRFPAHKGLFLYQGSRTDTHVREHEVYELDPQAIDAARVLAPVVPLPAASAPAAEDTGTARRRLAVAGAALSATVLLAAVLIRTMPLPDASEVPAARTASPTLERPLVLRQTGLSKPPLAQPPAVVPEAPAAVGIETAGPSTAAADTPRHPAAHEASPSARASARNLPTREARARAATSTREAPARSAAPMSAAPAAAAVTPGAPAENAAGSEAAPAGDAWRSLLTIQLPSASPPKKAATALVLLAISPWGEVFVDGKSMGVSPPLAELELSQGKHRIVVRNSDFKAYDEEIELGSNQTLRIKHKFVRR